MNQPLNENNQDKPLLHGGHTAICYLRTPHRSGESAATVSSVIDQQRRACEDKARELGLTIVSEFIDANVSGRPDRRPGFGRMLDYPNEHPVDGIVFERYDRIARDPIDMLTFATSPQKGKAILYSATEGDWRLNHALMMLTALRLPGVSR